MLPTLTGLLKSSDPGVRSLTASLLGEIGPEAKDAVLTLEELLNDDIKFVAKAAAKALKRINGEVPEKE